MTAHKHATLMLQYAQDAAETETPWERWKWKGREEIWFDCKGPIAFRSDCEYLRKPRTININGYEVPEPVREPLQDGDQYWIADTTGWSSFCWRDYPDDRRWLANGLIHLTEEAAQAHVEALLSFTRRNE